MEKMNDYDQTEAFTGEYEKIKLGGQICEIKEAKIDKSKSGKDMLAIAFDIAEGENKGYYKRKFDNMAQASVDAKWPGVHRILLQNLEGKCNPYFKGFISSVEASNPGYKWVWDEKTLKGKKFGAVYGREQYRGMDGNLKFANKIRFIRSIDKVKDAEIPDDKLLREDSTSDAWNTVIDDGNCPF